MGQTWSWFLDSWCRPVILRGVPEQQETRAIVPGHEDVLEGPPSGFALSAVRPSRAPSTEVHPSPRPEPAAASEERPRIDEDLEAGSDWLTELHNGGERLDLSDVALTSDQMMELATALGPCSSLRTLEVMTDSQRPEASLKLCQALQQNQSVTSLTLGVAGVHMSLVRDLLSRNSTLKALTLHVDNLQETGLSLLAEALRLNTSLLTLNVNELWVHFLDARPLTQALLVNRTLTSLTVSNCSFVGVEGFAGVIQAGSTLAELGLNHAAISDVVVTALGESLKHSVVPERLSLAFNSITGVGAEALAEGLRANCSLTSLDLHINPVGDNGAIALAQLVACDTALTSLNLGSCQIGRRGAEALAVSLQMGSKLLFLNLYSNPMGERGGLAFTEALSLNSTLTQLSLLSCGIPEHVARMFIEVMETNCAITSLSINDSESQRAINRWTAKNALPHRCLQMTSQVLEGPLLRFRLLRMSGEEALSMTVTLAPTANARALQQAIEAALEDQEHRIRILLPGGKMLDRLPEGCSIAEALR